MKIILLCISFFFAICLSASSSRFTCSPTNNEGKLFASCFKSNGCYDISCVDGACVKTSKCTDGTTCNLHTLTCDYSKNHSGSGGKKKNTIVKGKLEQQEEQDKMNAAAAAAATGLGKRNFSPNLILNGGFEDGVDHWKTYTYLMEYPYPNNPYITDPSLLEFMGAYPTDPTCYGLGFNITNTTTAQIAPPEGDNELAWFTLGPAAGGEFYQEFRIPFDDCVTRFHLSYDIYFNNTFGFWIDGISEIEPIDNYFLNAQSIKIQITTQEGVVLKNLFHTTPDTPQMLNYTRFEHHFELKHFDFDLLNFPETLRLRIRITNVVAPIILFMDDIRLTAHCMKDHFGRNVQSKSDLKLKDFSGLKK